ncbi:response regulator transcription factor [Arthrobacter sulfonylureivorans]|uniref:Response regulator transcription factor n=1 Tax=Arthrobacter sulfonylureivorans TaxID=2486855 RepID=A0ABY3W513_9MICC|nr:response regulator transcription factor [Arthrobacter sulfonylureivorans]UNK45283.1 response regulator transcription factor [Arthrobacter sulfonylureivorans]
MNQPIRVLLVDDEPLVRSGLAVILGAHGDIEVVGEASDGTEVWPEVRRLQPDLVMMDVRMPQMDGIEATAQLVALVVDRPRILILTTFESDDYVYQALKAGADGFLLKRARPEQLLHTVRAVAAGDSIVFPAKLRELVAVHGNNSRDRVAAAGLSSREAEVLRHLASQEIAQAMFLGTETIKTHIGSILSKLRVRDRTQAVIAAYESDFMRPGA